MQTFASSQIWIHIYIHTQYIYKFRYASHTFAHSKTTSLKTCKTENTAKHECTQNPIIFFSRGETIRVRSIVPSKFRSPIGNTGRKRPQHILHSAILYEGLDHLTPHLNTGSNIHPCHHVYRYKSGFLFPLQMSPSAQPVTGQTHPSRVAPRTSINDKSPLEGPSLGLE